MKLLKPAILALCLFITGCGQDFTQPTVVRQPYQRFIPISIPIPKEPSNPIGLPWAGAFALDTKTGQLCWTYNVGENRTNSTWPNIPLCSNLLQQYPDR